MSALGFPVLDPVSGRGPHHQESQGWARGSGGEKVFSQALPSDEVPSSRQITPIDFRGSGNADRGDAYGDSRFDGGAAVQNTTDHHRVDPSLSRPKHKHRSHRFSSRDTSGHGASKLAHGYPSHEDRHRDARDAEGLIFRLSYAGILAHGYQHDLEFVVIPGSTLRRNEVGSFNDKGNLRRRRELIDVGAAVDIPGQPEFLKLRVERRFPSRAIAAKILSGVNLNADYWKAIPPP
jgi:hypothetical protein